MLSNVTSPELLEMVSSTPENGSEIDSSQNEKKGSYENLKKQVASLKRKKKENIISDSNNYTFVDWSFLQDLYRGKKVIF